MTFDNTTRSKNILCSLKFRVKSKSNKQIETERL